MGRPAGKNCGGCKFFDPDKRPDYADKAGFCLRYPPQVVTYIWQSGDVMSELQPERPWMKKEDWCGEHEQDF